MGVGLVMVMAGVFDRVPLGFKGFLVCGACPLHEHPRLYEGRHGHCQDQSDRTHHSTYDFGGKYFAVHGDRE